MLVLSLFPGIGLLDMAFEAESFCVVRGPDVLWGGDVRSFHPPPGHFAGVIGGPPCQAFSALANLVRAKGNEPRFGNLIPEFERCAMEADPDWLLMENVPRAPVAHIGPHSMIRWTDDGQQTRLGERLGYAVTDFVLCNSWLDSGNGIGQEQMRKRRFSFGVRGAGQAPDLRRWIKPAALVLPGRSAVVADARETPVAVGGSGKIKATRQPPVSGAHQCSHRPKGGYGESRTVAEMLRLQGLPEDFLDDAPFTMQGKRKAIGNGVPLPMGRALARAVRLAMEGAG